MGVVEEDEEQKEEDDLNGEKEVTEGWEEVPR